jgi:hypothetical protein
LAREKELVLVDASWDQSKAAGMRIIWYDATGKIKKTVCEYLEVRDAFHTEVKVVLRAMKMIREEDGEKGKNQIRLCSDLSRSSGIGKLNEYGGGS